MALPTLVAEDGSHAVLAFTCLDALQRWRSDARPVPVPAASAWLAGTQDASAVVIDVAGPVPLAVDGARLAALAAAGRCRCRTRIPRCWPRCRRRWSASR